MNREHLNHFWDILGLKSCINFMNVFFESILAILFLRSDIWAWEPLFFKDCMFPLHSTSDKESPLAHNF